MIIMKNSFMLLLSLFLTNSIFGQNVTLSSSHNGSSNGGSVSVEITNEMGQILDDSDFCISWTGPNGFLSTEAEPTSLSFGLHCAMVTDCNLLLDYNDGACIGENGDYVPKSFFGCISIVGATCTDLFLTFDSDALVAFPSSPISICQNDDSGSASYDLFFTPPCPSGICRSIDWYKDGTLIDQNFSSSSLSNIGPGEYCINIFNDDSFPSCVCDCEAYFCVTIESVEDEFLEMDSNVTDATCDNSDGGIDLNVFGGAEPYNVVWDNGIIDVTYLSNLSAGDYCVSITDNCGSVEEECFTIEDNCDDCPPLVAEISSTDYSWCRYYQTMTAGSVNVNITSGSGNYSITVVNTWTNETWDHVPTLEMFEYGEFCITIVDNECGEEITECVFVWFVENIWCGPKDESAFRGTYDPNEFNSMELNEQELQDQYIVNNGLHVLRQNSGSPDILIENGVEGIQAVYDVFNASDNSFMLHAIVKEESAISLRSEGVDIDNSNKSLKDIILSPNPASGNVHLIISNEFNDNLIVSIYDITGKLVLSQKVEISNGNNQIRLETARLKTGTYMVIVPGFESKKLVIIN